jgi:hypothetical protein
MEEEVVDGVTSGFENAYSKMIRSIVLGILINV